jgi:ABC-2 type transport system ATP-binding protein
VLSTHILPEVQSTCSRVVIIDEGQVIAQGSIEALTAGLGRVQTLGLRVARDADDLAARISALGGVTAATREGPARYVVRIEGGDEASERVAAWVVAAGCGLVELSRQRASLEDVFLNLVTEEPGEASS